LFIVKAVAEPAAPAATAAAASTQAIRGRDISTSRRRIVDL
jgi:hypothetical protein